MGQKVNPIGLRLGIVKNWDSRWYASKNYAKFLQADEKIRSYVMKKFATAGISKVEIERAAKNLRVNLHTSRPGIVIGKKGESEDGIYNQDLQGNMVLIELGGIESTEEEVNRTISVLAKAVSTVLQETPH